MSETPMSPSQQQQQQQQQQRQERGGRPISMAIFVAPSSSSSNQNIRRFVVWLCQARKARSSQEDPWKYTLEYFDWQEDVASPTSSPSSWHHLDAFLLRYSQASYMERLHLGISPQDEEASWTRDLQSFLEERVGQPTTSSDSLDNDSSESSLPPTSTQLQLISPLPKVDASKLLQSILQDQLLVPQEDVQLAVRGNIQLAQDKMLQQGLALWLQGEGLLSMSSNTTAMPDFQQSCSLQAGMLNSCLQMDRTAASCIHLLPPTHAGTAATMVGGTSHNNSLLGLLSQPCGTSMGKDTLELWLRQPLVDLPTIMYRQNAVTTLVQGVGKDSVHEALRAWSVDLPKLAKVLQGYTTVNKKGEETSTSPSSSSTNTKKPLQALYQLYLIATQQLPHLQEALETAMNTPEGAAQLLCDSMQEIQDLLQELNRCEGLVEAVLDLDLCPREYLVKPSYSTELKDLYQELQSLQSQVQDELQEAQDTWAAASGDDKTLIRLENCVVNHSDGGSTSSWQFRLPNTNAAKLIESSFAGSSTKLHRVLKNGVYFSTANLRGLSSQYQQVSAEYSAHSWQIVKDAMTVAATYTTVVERAASVVSTLDAITALARVAAYNPHGYCRPTLTDSDDDGHGMELEGARHPCVELQDDIEFIPNDYKAKLGSNHFMLVTGPNMGGKSTYIRSLGAIVCLAQIGAYVPATSAKINICHALLARVGAGDLQERGISTFMAEMLEASSILRTATKRSLIIIDELGRGTSTFDGYGLARAISEYLQKRVGCLTVFATHFHELTHMPGVQNCHVSAQKTNSGLTFLYQVRQGPCLESFGIQVAEMANVPSVVIQDAKRKAAELEDFGSLKRQKCSFVEKFCSLDIPALLAAVNQSSSSEDQTKRQLLELLAT